MTLSDILSRLEGVQGGNGQYSAKCPAHDDRRNSLSVSAGEDGKILLHCHAGCSAGDVAAAIGLTMKDLFTESRPREKPRLVATYQYRDADGQLIGEKLRYSDKRFTWRRPAAGGWEYKKPSGVTLYNLPRVLQNDVVFLPEGEKDVDTLTSLNLTAACSPDGAGPGKWRERFTGWLRGKMVFIIQDNDEAGRAFAQEEAAAISEVAQSVKVLDLCEIWPELPEHGDVSDLIRHMEKDQNQAYVSLMKLANDAPEWEENPENDPFLACFKTLDQFEEEEASWLIPEWIPEAQITLMAADGGVGKTTMWCNMIAALSKGELCFLDPPGHVRAPVKVAFLTTEDSVRKKLKRKLRLAGAVEKNVITPDFLTDKKGVLRGLKFGSREMERFIKHFRPALCIFDPVQGFVPPDVNMGSRNAMRDCMASLISLGEECGTTFLVICHTNKRKGAFGRDRIADSADLWDISRSVLMAGFTGEQDIRYLSNEKTIMPRCKELCYFLLIGQARYRMKAAHQNATGNTCRMLQWPSQRPDVRTAKNAFFGCWMRRAAL